MFRLGFPNTLATNAGKLFPEASTSRLILVGSVMYQALVPLTPPGCCPIQLMLTINKKGVMKKANAILLLHNEFSGSIKRILNYYNRER